MEIRKNYSQEIKKVDKDGAKAKQETEKKEETAKPEAFKPEKVDPKTVEKFMNAQAATRGTIVKPGGGVADSKKIISDDLKRLAKKILEDHFLPGKGADINDKIEAKLNESMKTKEGQAELQKVTNMLKEIATEEENSEDNNSIKSAYTDKLKKEAKFLYYFFIGWAFD